MTPADTFTSDASAAGYMNPNRVKKEHLLLFVQHNQRYFREADMTIAPMVLDWDQPSPEVKDAFQQFAPDGCATIVDDMHRNGDKQPGFYLFRVVWTNPSNIIATINTLRQQRPELNMEVLDPHTFFAAFKKLHEGR